MTALASHIRDISRGVKKAWRKKKDEDESGRRRDA